MTPERWKRLEQIFHAAREAGPANRAAYLAAACGHDQSLRREIEDLLADADALSQLESRARSMTAPASLPAGTKVGPYVIKEHLDAGGMGVVYRALDARLDRPVAIKIGLAQFSDRFLREARAVARLNHVNVCTLHDIGSTPDIPGYLVMEFIDGSTLASRLDSGPMPVGEAVNIASQIAAGLAVAHEHGIVHRDLKPANIKITPQGVVKILDFGLAKDFPSLTLTPTDEAPTSVATTVAEGTLTSVGTVIGTTAYMSPEQAEGRSADARSDVFSFGIVLYEMLCRRRPFTGQTPAEIRAAIVGANYEPPRQIRAEIPERLQFIVSKCLQRLPGARYASGAELHDDLEKLIETLRPARFWSRRTLLAAAVLVISIAAYSGWQTYRRQADARWVEGTAVPQITTLLEQNRALEALGVYRRAERLTPNSKLLYRLADGVTSQPVRFETTPPGAKIYVSDYKAGLGDDLSRWQFVGTTPVTLPVPDWGYYRLRAIKEGFAPSDQIFNGGADNVSVALHETGTVPLGMVWVPPGDYVDFAVPRASVPGFWIDRFEVTNRQFADFVNARGYTRKEYWKEPFVKDGRPIAWEQGMSEFHDLTGRPGPRNWSLGTFPEGAADVPVAGVSWYEAMAYAQFAGKSIPTVYEWRRAAPTEAYSDVVQMSNFNAKAPARGGAFQSMTSFGAYDMAGNVKEWTANAAGTRRYALGGAWNEVSNHFFSLDALDPFLRTVSMGFRTVKRVTPPPAATFAAIAIGPSGPVRTEKPADDQTYSLLANLHRYPPSAGLDARVDRTDDSPPFWIKQRVSFNAAYANDRVIAHLFLPKNAAPPFQVVIVLAGFGIHTAKRVEDFGYPFEFLVRSGRAVMIPAFWGTLERGPSEFRLPENQETERAIKWSNDLGRSIDYLQTRPDIDGAGLGYYGISWGATHAPRLLAVETRLRAAVMVSGSLMPLAFQAPQVDPWNFAPRDRVPTLMVNGRHDFTFDYETNVKLLFNALGAPAADKHLVRFDGGHVNIITRPDLLGEIIAWFDRYLGRVRERDE